MILSSRSATKVRTIASRILQSQIADVTDRHSAYQALTHLSPFQPVIVQLLRLVEQDDSGATQVARLVKAEPSVASEVLALANCPLFGLAATVNNLQQAISLLGFERVKALVAAIGLRAMMTNAPKTPAVRRCWRHSIACGLIARELAPAYGVSKEKAYTVGMLHDVGRLGMMASYPDKYSRFCCMMHEDQASVLRMEKTWFEMNHCQAGLFLVRKWQLPPMFQSVASLHHCDGADDELVSLIQLACLLADAIGLDAIRYKLPKLEAVVGAVPAKIRPTIESKLSAIEPAVGEWLKALDC